MPSRLPSLTGLRFWAALLVVLYHLSRKVGGLPVLDPLAWYGRSGVTFFFVLSGFVLAWTYGGSPVPTGAFARRRFARIWPLHVLSTVLSLGADAAIGTALPVAAALWSLLLVHPWAQATVYGGNPASWSLGAEAWFYLLFPLLLRLLAPRRRAWLPVAAVCAALGPALWAAGPLLPADPTVRGWLLDYLPLARTPQFVLGVAVGLAVRHGLLPGCGSARRPRRWRAGTCCWRPGTRPSRTRCGGARTAPPSWCRRPCSRRCWWRRPSGTRPVRPPAAGRTGTGRTRSGRTGSGAARRVVLRLVPGARDRHPLLARRVGPPGARGGGARGLAAAGRGPWRWRRACTAGWSGRASGCCAARRAGPAGTRRRRCRPARCGWVGSGAGRRPVRRRWSRPG